MLVKPNQPVEELPLLPLKDVVVFPHMIIPLFVFEEICINAVEAACKNDRQIFVSAFQVTSPDISESHLASTMPPPFDVYDVGTVATVLRTRKLPDGRTKILLHGLRVAKAQSMVSKKPIPTVFVSTRDDEPTVTTVEETETLISEMKKNIDKLVGTGRGINPDLYVLLHEAKDLSRLSYHFAAHLDLKVLEGQKILETKDPSERLRLVRKQLDILASGHNPRTERDEVTKTQREYMLKEQLKNIKSELGDNEGKDELDELKEKILSSSMPSTVEQESLKFVRRLQKMNPESSEANTLRTYLEYLCELPWKQQSVEKVELSRCKSILNEEHFGLNKIKDRILEYIAVYKLNPETRGVILCFVGPPGVGKTSLGKSIAAALGRKFCRISLGGVRDEAEIRGHRRTYVGAMAGRIIQAIKQSGANNPVIMLDEIDKLANDHRGDPTSALLEVLDPEQNNNFVDHYVAHPFNLRNVIFIANANKLDAIPSPLRDRLEIIEVSGYSDEEKNEIARSFVIPKNIKLCGLTFEHIQIPDQTIQYIIHSYTRESGLRNLERQINAIVRKVARQVAENGEKGKEWKTLKVTPKIVREFLGEEIYTLNDIELEKPEIGVSVGLAYTQAGGDTLQLEVKPARGTGKLMMTGQLGEVMKESAQTALSYIVANASLFHLDVDFHLIDLHLHIPQGAIPKDGPSAGCAIACAMLSALLRIPYPCDWAMTGELTLSGRVLAIGGVREKLLAAIRAGIQNVILPERNKGAYEELPNAIKRKINVFFVNEFNDIFDLVFAKNNYPQLINPTIMPETSVNISA